MILLSGKIHELPKLVKMLISFFIITLSFGYYSGLYHVSLNTNTSTKGIEEQYLGNEFDENAMEMKFKKQEKELITTIHNHVISFSFIFFILGIILSITSIHPLLKKVLIIEPFISIFLTFGGIWLMWQGLNWFKYIILISGTLLTLSFTISIILIFYQLLTNIRK